jgi:magnesium transporter
MIRTTYRHRSGAILTDLTDEQLVDAVGDSRGTLWVDMQDPTPDEYEQILRKLFDFHKLAIEDTVKDVHGPKIDDYGDSMYIVFHVITPGDERMDIHTEEVDVFLGRNYLVTVHDDQNGVFDRMQAPSNHEKNGLARGPSYLLYQLIDLQIDISVDLFSRFEDRLDVLGDQIFDNAGANSSAILNDLLTAKSSALRLRRVLVPQREVLDRLMRQDYASIPAEHRIYFRDVHDHLVRLADLADSMRDLATSTIETHLALVNNRMNEVMKVLTVFAAIFIPLTFIAGVYGMNFSHMPELDSPWGYPMIWAVFISIVVGMLWFFRRRQWL